MLTKLIAAHIGELPGADVGMCYICGEQTARGHRKPPSELFTDWARCVAGDVLCPACAACISHRPVRHYSWLVTRDTFRVQSKEDKGWLWDVLMDPPPPPYALYFARVGQKQGWLSIVHRVSQSRDSLIGTDWLDAPAWVRDTDRATLAPVILRLRQRGVSKRALVQGVTFPKTWETAIKEGWLDDLHTVDRYVGDPTWETMIYASN